MPKEVLIYIWNNKLYYYMIILLVEHFLLWLVIVELGLKANAAEAGIKKVCISLIPGIIYTYTGKLFIPLPYFAIGSILIQTLIYMSVGKIPPLRSLITTLLIGLLIMIGNAITVQIFRMLSFLYITPFEAVIGTILEIFLPTVLLVISSVFNINIKTLATSRISAKKSEMLGMLFYMVLSFLLLYMIIVASLSFIKIQPSILLIMLTGQILLVIVFGLTYFFSRYFAHKREMEEELIKNQIRAGNQLVATLASQNRELRNMLQVIQMKASGNMIPDLLDYINQISSEIKKISDFEEMKNAIVASLLLTKQIHLREIGIEIKTRINSSLMNFSVNPAKLEEVLDRVFDLLVQNKLKARERKNILEFVLDKQDQEYVFDFAGSGQAKQNTGKGEQKEEIRAESPAEDRDLQEQTLIEEARHIMRELDGELVVTARGFQLRFNNREKH